jgi:hypothetical protein
MKPIKAVTGMIVAFLLLGSLGFAQADEPAVDPGMTPDNPFYFIEGMFQGIQDAFTFDPFEKAGLRLQFAEEKLAEAKAMADAGNAGAARTALEGHASQIRGAREALAAVPEDGSPEQARQALERAAALQDRAEDVELKALRVIEAVSEKVLATASPEAKEALEAAFGRVKENLQALDDRAEGKKADVKAKLKAVTGASEEELEALENEAAAEAGLAEGRRERANVARQRTLESIDRAISEARESGVPATTVSTLQQERQRVDSTLSQLRQRLESNPADDSAEEAFSETAQGYRDFGAEVSDLAQKIRTGEATPQDVVNLATTIHTRVLAAVAANVPEEALASVQSAMGVSTREVTLPPTGSEEQPSEIPSQPEDTTTTAPSQPTAPAGRP